MRVPIPNPAEEITLPIKIIVKSGRLILPKETMLAALKVQYSDNIYIVPRIKADSHFFPFQKLFVAINREMTKVVTGSNPHKNINPYAIASAPSVKNQKAITEKTHIIR